MDVCTCKALHTHAHAHTHTDSQNMGASSCLIYLFIFKKGELEARDVNRISKKDGLALLLCASESSWEIAKVLPDLEAFLQNDATPDARGRAPSYTRLLLSSSSVMVHFPWTT